MLLLKAMLRDIGFDEAIKVISDQGLRFSPREFAYTLAWMTVNDADAPYQLNEMDLSDLAVLLTVPKPPLKDDLYDFYEALTEDECDAFVDELARCYQRAGLIDGFVVFFDNHTIPYYGGVPIGFVYHATRNMPIWGIHLAQLNSINGNFILFKLVPSTTEFADILIELIERMKRVLNITTPLILVVDREAEALPLFQKLNRRKICFIVVITKNSKTTEERGDKIARYEFVDAPNIHLQKRYEKLQEQLPKVEARVKQRERELENLRERYGKKERIFKDSLRSKEEEFKRLEERLRKAGEREVFQGQLKNKIDERDVCIQKYSTALSELENRMELVTGKLRKEQAKKEKIEKELESIDFEAKFFQLNTASTTFGIAVKEAVANANSELTRRISKNGKPMKVNRAKKVIYRLPGKITVGSSTKIVELVPIRNRVLRKRIERLCDWLTEKHVEDTDGKRLVFKVGTT